MVTCLVIISYFLLSAPGPLPTALHCNISIFLCWDQINSYSYKENHPVQCRTFFLLTALYGNNATESSYCSKICEISWCLIVDTWIFLLTSIFFQKNLSFPLPLGLNNFCYRSQITKKDSFSWRLTHILTVKQYTVNISNTAQVTKRAKIFALKTSQQAQRKAQGSGRLTVTLSVRPLF